LFWRIHQMDFSSYFIHFIIGTIVSTYFLNLAYQNMKFILKHKIAQKREEAVNREISKIFANDKNANKKDKDDRVLTRKNEVADFEATTFSIFYNNSFYLVCLIVLSFFVLKNFSPTVNYLFSVVTHAASSCYACNPCGTTWNPAVATTIQTATPTDYCRKTVTGSLVVKDSTSTCNPVNVLNNGVYCCQTDYCNTASKYSLKLIHIGFLLIFIRIIC
ncbi:unnamed protein product, partial [Rotaria magnacalcarata]